MYIPDLFLSCTVNTALWHHPFPSGLRNVGFRRPHECLVTMSDCVMVRGVGWYLAYLSLGFDFYYWVRNVQWLGLVTAMLAASLAV